MSIVNFGGLFSGIDTNSIIQQLLVVERQPQALVKQRQELAKTREAAIRDVNTRLLNLKTAAKALGEASLFAKVATVTSSDATTVSASAAGTPVAGAYAVTATQLARNEIKTQGSAITQAASADTLSFSLDGGAAKTVAIAAADSLATIADKINKAAIGVNAAVVDGKLRIDAAATIAVSDGDTTNGYDLAADLGFTTTQTHLDSSFTVDGTSYTRPTNTIADVVPGVSFTLLKLASATLTVSQPAVDSARVREKVQAFVDQYNSTYSFVRDKVNEAKVVPAKTAADQLKGALRSDMGLGWVLRDLRQALGNAVSGLAAATDEFAEIGISTGKSTGVLTASANSGTLVLDTTKLEQALKDNPQAVQDLFQRVGASSAENGLVRRLTDIIDPLTQAGGVLAARIDGYVADATRLDSRLADLERQVLLREKTWRAQFSAMERLIGGYQKSSSLFG